MKKNGLPNSDEYKTPYLTKRLLVTAARRGIRAAAKETMAVMGYNIIAKDGYLVKKYADGKIEVLQKIDLRKDMEENDKKQNAAK